MRIHRRSFLTGSLAAAAAAAVAPARRAFGATPDLDFASAVEAGRAIRSGQVSSVELTTRMLARITQYDSSGSRSPR